MNEAVKVCEECIEKGEGRNKELFDFLTKYYLENNKIKDFKRVIYKAVEQSWDKNEANFLEEAREQGDNNIKGDVYF